MLAEDASRVKRLAELAQFHQMIESEIAYRNESDRFSDGQASEDTGSAIAMADLTGQFDDGVHRPIDFVIWRESQKAEHEAARRREQTRRFAFIGGIAAAVFFGLFTLVMVIKGPAEPTPDIADQPPSDSVSTPETPDWQTPNEVQPIVATLTSTQNATWAEGHFEPGSPLRASQRLTLTQGFAKITTQRGAVAIIQAPATIELIDSPNALHLDTGKLVGLCHTDSSKGFVVKTDHADITDLGTEFGVEVQAGRITTTVFSGEVELSIPGGQPQQLVADQTARLTVEGNNRELVVDDGLAEGFEALAPRQVLAEAMRNDPAMIAYYDFEANDVVDGKLLNRARVTLGKLDGVLGQDGKPDSQPTFAEGRLPGTGALRFESSEFDIVRIGVEDARAVNGLERFTISLWVKPDNTDQLSHHLVTKRAGEGRDVLNLGLSWNSKNDKGFLRNAVFFYSDAEQLNEVSSEADSLRRRAAWTHILVTYDRGERVIYADGVLLKRLARIGLGRAGSIDAELLIGAAAPHLDNPLTYLDGDLDELFILGRVMTPDEIKQLYDAGVPR